MILQKINHSAAHVLAQAVLKLYPDAKLAIGPAIKNGFYYDFDLRKKISDNDFEKIEKEMQKIIDKGLKFQKKVISPEKAEKIFAKQPYKLELIKDAKDKGKKKLSIYQAGDNFTDLCRGPHLENTGQIKSFKLLSVAGAYWKGSEKNKMLTRIYGAAFPGKKELKKHLWQLEEAKKHDHRKLGKKLDLFTFSGLVGSGLPLYTPKGALVRKLINDHIEEIQTKRGYQQVWTPQIAKGELFKVSGHYDKYKNNMFKVVSNYSKEEFFLKPMNCPQHTQIYASRPRSYRDLPIRLTDFAMLYRDEKPGELFGLGRVRSFSQDDCHIFCREDQVDEEIDQALEMTKEIMKTYGFKYRYRLSTRDKAHPEQYLGGRQIWDKVEKWAETIMKRNKIDYYEAPGEAAFYAPKMDLMATDALGREWQLSTIQIDYITPERFKLAYTDKDGLRKHPIMIHRAIIGSPERFIMIILEHFTGALPPWLSPVQAVVLPISKKQADWAGKVAGELKKNNIRVELGDDNQTIGYRIRQAQEQKIPYMLIVGEREKKTEKISLRLRNGQDKGAMSPESFLKLAQEQIDKKTSL